MSFKVFDKHYKTTVEYKHKIAPVKWGDKFLPNTFELKAARKISMVFILDKDFEKYQRQGETILINNAGGWCTLDSDMEILADANEIVESEK